MHIQIVRNAIILCVPPVYLITFSQTKTDSRVLLKRKNIGREKTKCFPPQLPASVRDSTQTHLPNTARASDKHTHTHTHRVKERESQTAQALEQRRGSRQSKPSASLHYADRTQLTAALDWAHCKSWERTGFKELSFTLEDRSCLNRVLWIWCVWRAVRMRVSVLLLLCALFAGDAHKLSALTVGHHTQHFTVIDSLCTNIK